MDHQRHLHFQELTFAQLAKVKNANQGHHHQHVLVVEVQVFKQ